MPITSSRENLRPGTRHLATFRSARREQRARRMVRGEGAAGPGLFDRAIKSLLATELDPAGPRPPRAPGVPHSGQAAAWKPRKESVRLDAKCSRYGNRGRALRAKEFVRARMPRARARARSGEPRTQWLITRSRRPSLAATTPRRDCRYREEGGDPTIPLSCPVSETSTWRWRASLRSWLSRVSLPGTARMRLRAEVPPARPASADDSAPRDTKRKEA